MFTGLIIEIGIVRRHAKTGRFSRLTIAAPKTVVKIKIGDSVATAGACLTVEEINRGEFTCSMIAETMKATRLGGLRPGEPVNLELPVGPGDRFDGHLVAGHVDTVGRVKNIQRVSNGGRITIGFDRSFDKWVIDKGSIAIDGVSLTVAERRAGQVTIGIIPTTWTETTLGSLKPGSPVNLEFDQAVKAAINAGTASQSQSSLSSDALRRAGW